MRKKDESKKIKIESAVADIILEEGADAVSTVKVAKRVGISQSNVYLYFKNRDAMLLSVYSREIEKIKDTGNFNQLNNHDISLTERIRGYIKGVYEFSLAHPQSLSLIQQIKYLLGKADETPFPDTDQPTDSTVTALLTEGVKAGVLKPLPINVHMSLVFSVIHTHTLNINKGRYTENQYSFDDFYAFIWGAMAK
ncbi:TetR/AcrR family transcriptional regulator [Secundilactobacillus folii]|uniref:TetR family transcriptional regulator n=1 Tax=Secundilactobacillus folii TaxID=2678357 RepID=A0A7X2XXQ4_9LACO|nr:TetR/AcrR family transcriptional regulator [Secundilactobacillus folii]MTV82266.1 TetR family transcriptional regulator [Secundilactobacillus folii]